MQRWLSFLAALAFLLPLSACGPSGTKSYTLENIRLRAPFVNIAAASIVVEDSPLDKAGAEKLLRISSADDVRAALAKLDAKRIAIPELRVFQNDSLLAVYTNMILTDVQAGKANSVTIEAVRLSDGPTGPGSVGVFDLKSRGDDFRAKYEFLIGDPTPGGAMAMLEESGEAASLTVDNGLRAGAVSWKGLRAAPAGDLVANLLRGDKGSQVIADLWRRLGFDHFEIQDAVLPAKGGGKNSTNSPNHFSDPKSGVEDSGTFRKDWRDSYKKFALENFRNGVVGVFLIEDMKFLSNADPVSVKEVRLENYRLANWMTANTALRPGPDSAPGFSLVRVENLVTPYGSVKMAEIRAQDWREVAPTALQAKVEDMVLTNWPIQIADNWSLPLRNVALNGALDLRYDEKSRILNLSRLDISARGLFSILATAELDNIPVALFTSPPDPASSPLLADMALRQARITVEDNGLFATMQATARSAGKPDPRAALAANESLGAAFFGNSPQARRIVGQAVAFLASGKSLTITSSPPAPVPLAPLILSGPGPQAVIDQLRIEAQTR